MLDMRERCYACLDEVGTPEALLGTNKLFCVGSGPEGVRSYYAHVSNPSLLSLHTKSGALRPGVIGRVPLEVGDEVSARPPARASLQVECAG